MIFTMEYNTEELIENYNKKAEILKKILALASDQGQRLAADDIDGLLSDIEQRQKLQSQIDQIDAARHSILKLTENKDKSDACNTKIIKPFEDSIKELLVKIQEMDLANHNMAREKLEGYRKQIKGIQQSKKRVDSYVPHYAMNDGVYINTKK